MRLNSLLALVFLLFTVNTSFAIVDSNEPTSKTAKLEENATLSSTRYIFLKTVKKDCLEGDTEIVSSIIQVNIKNFAQEKYKILAKFENEVSKKYPKNVIHINLNCIEGVYSDLRSATDAKKALIDNVEKSRSIVLR
ncbi:hypothetical protein [Flammeovirga sp. EKP202]|uniref:hypothetical protein n=1 Tax=Flammeovirga sp. EKP202 TaxID=2770592 RepID=UPI00165FAF68|nr:hypothetical protein [Flammeovirga sp. EKP202]MBD0403397.1 hypothetical protein [Flammeovirga sp. EKP202]